MQPAGLGKKECESTSTGGKRAAEKRGRKILQHGKEEKVGQGRSEATTVARWHRSWTACLLRWWCVPLLRHGHGLACWRRTSITLRRGWASLLRWWLLLVHLRVGSAAGRSSQGSGRCGRTSVACIDASLGLRHGHTHLARRTGVGAANSTYRWATGRHRFGSRCAWPWLAALCSLDDLVIEHVERSAEHDPFHHVLVPLAQRLPHGLLLWRLSCDGDARSAASAAACCSILLDLAKLDSLWWDEMAGVGEIEHGPPRCIWVGF